MRASPLFRLALLAAIGCLRPALAQPSPPRSVRLGEVAIGDTLPSDLLHPEGRTRWDLSGLRATRTWVRTLEEQSGAISVVVRLDADQLVAAGRPDGEPHPLLDSAQVTTTATRMIYSDAVGGSDTARWLHPEQFPRELALGSRAVLSLDERREGRTDHLRIELDAVGIGWVHLPDGPHEAVLQRALILRAQEGNDEYRPETLLHRWVATDAGVVAEIWGPPSPDGRTRESISGARIAVDPQGAADAPTGTLSLTKLYENQLISPPLTGIGYGWDRGYVPISELTSQGYVTAGDLVNASSWNFTVGPATHTIAGTTTANNSTTINGSGTAFQTELRLHDKIALSSAPSTFATITNIPSNTQVTLATPLGNGTTQTILRKKAEVSNTSVSVAANETCNSAHCGYATPGAVMDRLDRYFDDAAALVKTNAVRERVETVGSDVTYYLRAGAQNEGLSGSLGLGEGRFCYAGAGRSNVPLWKFAHHDANGYYVQAGDSWTSSPFNCEQNIFNGACATDTCGLFCQFWLKAGSGHTGTQGGTAIKSGVVTLPSGHTFNSILFRTVADFCVYLSNSCGSCVNQVRTVVYLWQVPYLGTVVELDSAQSVPDTTSYSTVVQTIINFGLFPPRTIQTTGSTSTSVSLSWDPGLDTHRITGYRVYWDTDSGGASPYAFNSTSNPGQVSFAGTTATVSGLSPGTTYFFTVTALSTFTDPSPSGVVTTYESLRYPTQISGDPSSIYPIEVLAVTTGSGCTPTSDVTGLLLQKQGPTNIQFNWNAVSDPCAVGYRVRSSMQPINHNIFTTLTDTGLVTTWTGNTGPGPNPGQCQFFLVAARGGNGSTGP